MESKSRLIVLRRRSEFLNLQKNGLRVRPCEWLLINFMANPDGQMRCGWTIPRSVGTAVVRNRLRRWSRAFFRDRIKSQQTLPADINLVFRRMEGDFYKKLNYEKFSQVLEKGWRQMERRLRR